MSGKVKPHWQVGYPTEYERSKVGKSLAVAGQVRAIPILDGWVGSLWVELRPWQWAKNLLVLAPLLFSQNLFTSVAVVQALTAFALFCLVSSSVYLLNDIKDRKQDRLHPQKRHRPLASGKLGVGVALGMMVALLLGALAGGAVLNETFAIILFGYWFTNLLYSIWLKHQVILDVFAIASGFVLRVVGGGVAIQVEISHWLLLCTTLLALFLGFSKRRHELVLLGEEAAGHRQVLVEYSPRFLDMMIGIVTASTVMSYALYTVSEETVSKFHTRGLLLTLPFVLYGIFRYLYLVYHKDQGGDPTQNLVTDRPTVINLCLWALTAGVILHWQ
jgi:4-hydroxybenzoate polyprenyltransferase